MHYPKTNINFHCKNQHDTGIIVTLASLIKKLFAKMKRAEHRSIICFQVLDRKKTRQITENLRQLYGLSGPSAATVCCWYLDFMWRNQCTEDKTHCGWPVDKVNPENIDKVCRVISENR